ncbi:MAG TPA: hypothetical protein VLA02_18170 [Reyranella sp.]|nr:hypothetical protein [Reyranella sp.]
MSGGRSDGETRDHRLGARRAVPAKRFLQDAEPDHVGKPPDELPC